MTKCVTKYTKGWTHIGSIGWDAGSLIVASPENLYDLYGYWKSHQEKTRSSFYESVVGLEPPILSNEKMCSMGVLMLDNFGGDGMADIYVKNGRSEVTATDDAIRIIFSDFEKGAKIEKVHPECKIKWTNGMIIICDPVTFDDLFEKKTTLDSFLNDYAKNVSKSGLYSGCINSIYLDNLKENGSFSVEILRPDWDPIDFIITLTPNINQQLGGDSDLKEYTLDEVAKHNQRNDAWIALQGKVYDVTEWIPQHPGGDEILRCIGKDGTPIFESIGHPSYVYDNIRPKYLIGKLV
jgi:cytochrome b involved in lipid metabolism